MPIRYSVVKVFCNESGNSGNPAAVVVDYAGSNEKKAEIAKKLQYPVTTFITQSKSDLPKLEFYYPQSKMPLCLHGTLAAAKVLLMEEKFSTLKFITEGQRELSIKLLGSDCIQVKVSLQTIDSINVDVAKVSELLNIDKEIIFPSLPFAVASVGSPKLLVPIDSLRSLSRLKPNFELIKDWSIQNNVNGIYAYTHTQSPADFHARGFNPRTGHNEDIATGVAAAALSGVLQRDIKVFQGNSVPCQILVKFQGYENIWVGGKTIIHTT